MIFYNKNTWVMIFFSGGGGIIFGLAHGTSSLKYQGLFNQSIEVNLILHSTTFLNHCLLSQQYHTFNQMLKRFFNKPIIHVRNQNQISVSFKNYGQPHRWNSERARYIYKLIRTHIVAYFKNHWPFHWFQILKGKMKLEYKNFLGDLRSVKIVLYNNKTKKWRLSTI